jgi:hypothetical protein
MRGERPYLDIAGRQGRRLALRVGNVEEGFTTMLTGVKLRGVVTATEEERGEVRNGSSTPEERLLDRRPEVFDRVGPHLRVLCRRLVEFLNGVDEAGLEVAAAHTDPQPVGGLGAADRGAE